MSTRRWLAIAGLVVIGAAIALWRSDRVTGSSPAAAPSTQSSSGAARSRVEPTLVPRTPVGPRPARVTGPAFDASKQHTADPCTAVTEPVIPTGFETVTAQGITVAWAPGEPTSPGPTHVAVAPIAIAHLVGGLLEEAAQLTGTVRRSELTLIIYRSAEELRAATQAPSWAGGVYDGGAIRLFASPSEPLGVSLSTLRHESMHAHLHAAIGCMPFWLNEGLSDYISGTPPLKHWLELLGSPGTFRLDLLRNPALLDRELDARHAYGVSLAMVVYILEHGGQPALQQALRSVHDADTERAIELWDTLYPRVDYPAVLESLAQMMFGLPADRVSALVDGPLCCHGLNSMTTLSCRTTAARTSSRVWFETWSDLAAAPRAMCRNRW